MRRGALVALALAAIVSASVAASASGGAEHARKTTKITVADDYYNPDSLKVKPGTKLDWRWSPENTDTHNVVLTKKHPKGVKPADYRSASGSIGIRFKRKLKEPGTYGFICTFHRSVMKMTVKVKKR